MPLATTADKLQLLQYRPVKSVQSRMLGNTVLLGMGLVGRIVEKPDVSSEDSTRTVRWLLLADAALRIWKQADDRRDDTDHKPHDLSNAS
jgi:hypothetical protein